MSDISEFAEKFPSIMPTFFNDLSLKTKLLLMMLFLCFLSVALLFSLYSRAEQILISEIKRHTDEISEAIQISVEQITKETEGEKDDRLKEYVNMFKKKGIREISIVNNEKEVIASSNPKLIGNVLDIKGDSVKAQGNVKEYLKLKDGHRNYDILFPVIVGDEQLGYVHIAMRLDDFAEYMRVNHLKRLLATSLVFAIGIAVSMFLSIKYTKPIHNLVKAARKVASGDLTEALEVKGSDEIGELTMSFNEMVKSLREMRDMEERLRKAEHFSRIGQLASGVAHEIRNPLNFVNLNIDHLRVKYAPQDAGKRDEFSAILSGIKGEIHRLNRMVNNFLTYGKPLKLNIEMTSISDILDEVISLLDEKLKEQKIEIEKRFNRDLPDIPADREQIKTCIMNLFINAIQSMTNRGRLTIETGLNNGFASVKIKDTGDGIAAEHISNIFEPYFTTKESGIGLGLAITKRIIEEHRGRIYITSEMGKGTDVTVELPINQPKGDIT